MRRRRRIATAIFATADVKISSRGFGDPLFISCDAAGAHGIQPQKTLVSLDAKQIVGARTTVRCCLENLYWIVGHAEDNDKFVKQMRDDELSHKRALGQVA